MMTRRGLFLCLLAAAPIPAQIRMPIPGTGRGGRMPSPIPRGGGGGRRDRKDKEPDEPLATFRGTVKSLDSKQLVLARPEAEPMTFECNKKTSYYEGSKQIKRSAIKTGDMVEVEARPLADGKSAAVNVRLEHMSGS